MTTKADEVDDRFEWERTFRECEQLASTTKVVLYALGTSMDRNGKNAHPSTRTLARWAGLSRRSVEEHLRIAAEAGWIERESAGVSGQGWKRLPYVPTIPRAAQEPPQADPPDEAEEADRGEEALERYAEEILGG